MLKAVTDRSCHKDCWEQWYEEERDRLLAMLPAGRISGINHIGSTAVSTIWAKPIIDILLEIPRLDDVQDMGSRVEQCGYLRMSDEKERISFNRGYTPEEFAERVFHLHLRYAGDNDELYFRDYLRVMRILPGNTKS